MSEKYLDELKAWRAELETLKARVAAKRLECEAGERELGALTVQLVDSAGPDREDISYAWRDARAALTMSEAELAELSKRLTLLRVREPARPRVNNGVVW